MVERHRSPGDDVAVESVMPSLHDIVGPDWWHKHGPVMDLEYGAVDPQVVFVVHDGDYGIWCST